MNIDRQINVDDTRLAREILRDASLLMANTTKAILFVFILDVSDNLTHHSWPCVARANRERHYFESFDAETGSFQLWRNDLIYYVLIMP